MIETLLRASFEGAVLAAAVWLLLRIIPRISPAVKATLWWCVAAKFVIALLPVGKLEFAVLPSQFDSFVVAPVTQASPVQASGAPLSEMHDALAGAPSTEQSATPLYPSTVTPNDKRATLTVALLVLWATGLAISLARTANGWNQTRRIITRSVPVDRATAALLSDVAALLGVRSRAELRYSSEIDSPLIAGVIRPVILVPADRFPQMSRDHQRMVLCHELVHLKRRDVLFSCIPAAAERLFFFHPLSRLAAQEYAFWREAACDAAVMAALQTPARSYGRLLLDLGVSRQPSLAVANAAMSFSTLKRRLVMLDVSFRPSAGARAVASLAVALSLITIAPVRLVARQANDVRKPVVSKSGDVRTATTAASAASAASASTIGTTKATASARPAAAATSAARAKQSERAPATVQSSAYSFVSTDSASSRMTSRATRTADGYATSYSSSNTDQQERQDRLEYVLFINDSHTTMSGSSRDMQRAREFRERDESLLWFRLDGREYVVRDASVLRAAEDLWEPVGRLGAEQGKLGAQQGVLGARQGEWGARVGELGAEQGLIGAKQGALGAQLGVLAAREARRISESERSEIARERARIDREMRELDREMRALNDRLRDVDRPQGDLGREMGELGKVMGELGRQMGEASRRAERDMLRLVERAIDSGAARQVR